jgi:hypothetical protein
MRRWLRGSSSHNSEGNENEEKKKPKYNLPRAAEVRPCEWPSDTFLREARIYDDFYYLAENAGITAFLQDKCDQYLLLTNTFVQNFRFHSRKDPPMVKFHLYDEPKEMTLHDFCNVCKTPYDGRISEPCPRDMADFIADTTVGEERGVSEARVASLHFSHFTLLCIICREMSDWSWREWNSQFT